MSILPHKQALPHDTTSAKANKNVGEHVPLLHGKSKNHQLHSHQKRALQDQFTFCRSANMSEKAFVKRQ